MASVKVLFWAILSYFMFLNHNHGVEVIVLFFLWAILPKLGEPLKKARYNYENLVKMPYLNMKDMSDTATTKISSKLNAARQNDPGWRMTPYEISFKHTSTVNIVVKK